MDGRGKRIPLNVRPMLPAAASENLAKGPLPIRKAFPASRTPHQGSYKASQARLTIGAGKAKVGLARQFQVACDKPFSISYNKLLDTYLLSVT